ncbi:hypothetical protein T08_10687 [Trichinella sp. T8]|nr:hypothetical protein T08_10687 [Trichinella sp. T8]
MFYFRLTLVHKCKHLLTLASLLVWWNVAWHSLQQLKKKNILLARCRICFFDFATQLVEWLLLLAKCYRRSYDSLFGVVSFDVEQLTGYQSNAELEAVLPFPLVSS